MKHSKACPLPQGWMSLDIKLGSLTLTLEEGNFAKGIVDEEKSNALRLLMREDTPGSAVEEPAAADGIREESKEDLKPPNMINMGSLVLN
jgi:hypothetical protein